MKESWIVTPRHEEEEEFLKGSREDPEELASAGRVFLEFVRGFQALGGIGQCVTVFGSARFKEGHHHYEKARALGKRLAEEGMTVMTGGGPANATRTFVMLIVENVMVQSN